MPSAPRFDRRDAASPAVGPLDIGRPRFRTSAAHVFAAQLASGGSDFVIAVALARLLGPSGFGIWSAVVVAATVAQLVAGGGLSAAVVFYAARGSIGDVAPPALRLGVGLGLAGGIALWLLLGPAHAISGVGPGRALLGAVGVPAMIVWSIAVNALFGAHRTARYAAHSLGLAVVSGVAVVAVGLGHRVTAVLVAWAAAQVVAALVAFVDVARLSGRHPSSTSRRALLSYGTRAQASNLVTFLNYRLDVLLVVALASTAEAGRYAAVVVLAEGLWFVSMVAGTVLFPRVAAEADEVRRRDLTELVARLTWWATAITAVIAALLAGPLLRVVFGRSMEVASGAFRVTLIGVTLLAMARVLANYTAGVGRPGLNAVGSLLALGVNVALNFALIPRHGITGAATATAISYGVLTAYQLVVYARIGSPGRVPLGLFLPRSGDIVALRGAVAGFRNGD